MSDEILMTRDQQAFRDIAVELNASIDRFFVVADAQQDSRTPVQHNIVRQIVGAQKWLKVWLREYAGVLQNS